MLFVSVLGGTFITLALLEKKLSINGQAVKIAMEAAKYSTLGYLVYVAWKVFM